MSLSADFNLDAPKDTYDYSWFLARLDEDRHSMTCSPGAIPAAQVREARLRGEVVRLAIGGRVI
jgi:hypothetical protein